MSRSQETPLLEDFPPPTLSRTASWGNPRTTTSSHQQTQLIDSRHRSALDSSDEESYVNVSLGSGASTPSPSNGLAGDCVPCSDPSLAPRRMEALRPEERSEIQIGTSLSVGDCVSSSLDQQPQLGSIRESIVRGPSPFSELLVHTNTIWRKDYDSLFTGYVELPYTIPLFDSSTIREDPDQMEFLNEFSRRCYQHNSHHYYVDLFFQMRFFSRHKKREKRSSPTALMQAWEQFVNTYRQSPSFWMMRFRKARDLVIEHSLDGAKMNVHQKTIEAGFPCGVRPDQNCPFCYSESAKLPLKARYEDTVRYLVPKEIRLLMFQLDVRCLNEATDEKEAKEFDEDEDVLKEEFFNRDATLRMQQQVAASSLEIHRMKRQNLSLAKEVRDLKKHSESIEQ